MRTIVSQFFIFYFGFLQKFKVHFKYVYEFFSLKSLQFLYVFIPKIVKNFSHSRTYVDYAKLIKIWWKGLEGAKSSLKYFDTPNPLSNILELVFYVLIFIIIFKDQLIQYLSNIFKFFPIIELVKLLYINLNAVNIGSFHHQNYLL